MMYNEFVEGTGCKDNEHNYKVYRDLEVMYMNSDLTKEQIYEYGKKLVDNSKSPAQVKIEEEMKQQIKEYKEQIEYYKSEISRYEYLISVEDEDSWKKEWKRMIKVQKDLIKEERRKINGCKLVLGVE